MDNKQKASVKGLANIGKLLNRADLPTAPTPKRDRRDLDQIHERTMEKIGAAVGGQATATQMGLVREYVKAAVREAHNLGHAGALEQNSAVEKLLEKQFEVRTQVTMPAVAAAIMEQRGLSSMTLDLALAATVFKRCVIDYTVSGEDVIDFQLTPLDEV